MTERLKEIKSVYEDYKELQKKGDFKQADIALLYLSENHIDWIINRIEELEKVIGDLDENVAAFETLWLEEKRKNQRYKQALEFYADEEHYKEKLISVGQYDADGICISKDEYAPPIIYFDRGEKARKTLKGE